MPSPVHVEYGKVWRGQGRAIFNHFVMDSPYRFQLHLYLDRTPHFQFTMEFCNNYSTRSRVHDVMVGRCGIGWSYASPLQHPIMLVLATALQDLIRISIASLSSSLLVLCWFVPVEMARYPEGSEVLEGHQTRELHPLQGRLSQGYDLLGKCGLF